MLLKKSIIRWLLIWFVASTLWQPAFAWMTDIQNNPQTEAASELVDTAPPCHSMTDSSQMLEVADAEQEKTLCCSDISCDCQHMTSVILPSLPEPTLRFPTHCPATAISDVALQSPLDNLFRPPIV